MDKKMLLFGLFVLAAIFVIAGLDSICAGLADIRDAIRERREKP